MAKTAEPDDHGEVAGLKDLRGLVGRMIGRQAGVGVRRDLLGLDVVGKTDQVPFLDLKIVGKAAVTGDARKRAVLAVHVVAPPARGAGAIGDERVHDHGVALLEAAYLRPRVFDPAGIFVARGVGELNAHLVAPDALDNVQVGPTEPGAPDPDDHVI